MEADVKAKCIEVIPGWSRLEPGDIAVRCPKAVIWPGSGVRTTL